MAVRCVSRIIIITSILATFVLYLCASVSKILPLFVGAAFNNARAVFSPLPHNPFSQRICFIQKRE